MAKSDILLEVGTNELEILEFTLAGGSFGINVAKIREIKQYEKPHPMPRSHPFVEGVYQPREKLYTVIDLGDYLGLPSDEDMARHILIIASFNKIEVAFHVHSVVRIHRISWNAIEKPNSSIYGGEEGIVTGIAKLPGRIISIIDFEKIMFDISPESGIQVSEVRSAKPQERNRVPILVAEDSVLLRRMLLESLHKAGFDNVIATANGEEAWQFLESVRGVQPLTDRVACVITDIEMPKMDGHRLTKLIKSDPEFKALPVLIFSSLIDENMREKGNAVGADEQLSKPEIGNLVGCVEKHTINKQ